jgi:hypothetical protein
MGHTVSAVCYASRGVQSAVVPAPRVSTLVLLPWGSFLCPWLTLRAISRISKTAAASLRRHHPGAIAPRRPVADMLLMATGHVRYPLLRVILMQTDAHALPRRLASSGTRGALRLVEDSERRWARRVRVRALPSALPPGAPPLDPCQKLLDTSIPLAGLDLHRGGCPGRCRHGNVPASTLQE